MIYLFLCILCATSINVIFKTVENHKGNTFYVILINYIVASILGLIIAFENQSIQFHSYSGLLPVAAFMGAFFILMFYLMALSVQKAGITATTVAGRMSVIIPIVFSIIHYNESTGLLKIAGIIMALLSVILSVYKERNGKIESRVILLPVLIFFGAGTLDSIIKYVQHEFLNDQSLPFFSSLVFFFALLVGLIFLIRQKTSIKKVFTPFYLLWGTLLGISNFGAFFLFVKALTYSGLESSVVFGLNHIGIVGLSVLLALQIFKEKLNRINWIGIVLAACAVLILANY